MALTQHISRELMMIKEINEEALKLCCSNYEKASLLQQDKILILNKKVRAQELRIKKLEKIILNNMKNGTEFIK